MDMGRPVMIALGAAVVAGIGALALAAGDAASERPASTQSQRVEHEGGPRATHLLVSSEGRHRIAVAQSFCAPANGEPIALACGSSVRVPRGRAFFARPGAPVTLRLGTAARDVWIRYSRVGKNGRVVALTHAAPLRSSGEDGRAWKLVVPRDPAVRRKRLVAVLSVAYRDPIRLDVRGRQTKPFTDAFAEFALPLRIDR